MKKLLLLLVITPLTALTQTKTTVSDGDFFNPFIWDCSCLPTNGDDLIINHDVVLNLDVAYTQGSITINSSGSLIEDATDRAFWVDGTGTMSNAGTFTSHLLLVSPDAEITNTGAMPNVDSVWIQGSLINTGTIQAFDVLNDETSNFDNQNEISITNDFNNQGYFYIAPSASLEVGNNFSNCNLQSLDAYFDNDGIMCISNDFSNCPDDTIAGEGNYFIGGSSSNLGVLTGNITVHTPSGSLDIAGTVDPSVTVTTGSCTLNLNESSEPLISTFPNPVRDNLSLSIASGTYAIIDLEGRTVQQGSFSDHYIPFSQLKDGAYILQVDEFNPVRILKTKTQ